MAKSRPGRRAGTSVPSAAPVVAPVTQQAWMEACSHKMRRPGQDRALGLAVRA
jgi:hypothetical protein